MKGFPLKEARKHTVIISKTPFRVSFFGGGTDFPQWYLKEGGAVLSTTIDKYCYITCRALPPFFPNKHRIVWSHIEKVSDINDILHPAVKAGLRYLNFDNSTGIEIHHQGDLPARSGMGSSSSFAVGLIHALTILKGETISKGELAQKAIELEQVSLKESVGSQDQVAAAYGGFNVIRFEPSGDISVDNIDIKISRLLSLQSHLMLFFTGITRNGTDIATKTISNLSSKKETLKKLRHNVDRGLDILTGNSSIEKFGELLHEGWKEKCQLTPEANNDLIRGIYDTARDNGAIGGKLLGSGGGGFVLLFAPPEKHGLITEKLSQFLPIPFKFENEGSSIILNVTEEPVTQNHIVKKAA